MRSGSHRTDGGSSSKTCASTLQDLFERYGGAEGDAFKLAVACYPKGDQDHD